MGRLVLYDALAMKFRELKLRKNPECLVCGDNPTVTELIDYEQFCGVTPELESNVNLSEDSGEITPVELKSALDEGEKLTILDVREPHEYEISSLPNSILIPLGQLPSRMNELNRQDNIVVHCKMGGRSAKAVELMKQAGFNQVKNLTGGINRWGEEIDPSLPRY